MKERLIQLLKTSGKNTKKQVLEILERPNVIVSERLETINLSEVLEIINSTKGYKAEAVVMNDNHFMLEITRGGLRCDISVFNNLICTSISFLIHEDDFSRKMKELFINKTKIINDLQVRNESNN